MRCCRIVALRGDWSAKYGGRFVMRNRYVFGVCGGASVVVGGGVFGVAGRMVGMAFGGGGAGTGGRSHGPTLPVVQMAAVNTSVRDLMTDVGERKDGSGVGEKGEPVVGIGEVREEQAKATRQGIETRRTRGEGRMGLRDGVKESGHRGGVMSVVISLMGKVIVIDGGSTSGVVTSVGRDEREVKCKMEINSTVQSVHSMQIVVRVMAAGKVVVAVAVVTVGV